MEGGENVKISPSLLFADENLCFASPEAHVASNTGYATGQAATQHIFHRNKSPIRRLTFEHEARLQSSNVPVEINKVTEFKKFAALGGGKTTPEKVPRETKAEENKTGTPVQEDKDNAQFYQLRSSPIQMFNSFSPSESYLSQTIGPKFSRGGLVYSEGKVVTKKMCCNCKKSHCLKLYCECFASKGYCSGCNCVNCLNTRENDAIREKAMQATLERNPIAFDPKITRAQVCNSN